MPVHAPTAAALTALMLVGGPAAAGVTFGPIKLQPGQRVRMIARSLADNGRVETRGPDGNTSARMTVERAREIVWTIQERAANGTPRVMIRLPQFVTISTLVVNNRPDVRTEISPLTDKLLAATRNQEGKWEFVSDGRVLGKRDQELVEELAAYQDRAWFPEREVQVGDSWEFDPKWIKLVVQRDLRDALAVGTMTLREVRLTRAAQTAAVELVIRSSGTKLTSSYRETAAIVDLRGRAVVNLQTMLDESLELEGMIHSESSDGSRRTIVDLPVRLSVTKKVEPGGGLQ
jgi:hypothetical protein